MENKANKKLISKKQFCFALGLFISLLSVIMIMNIGVPARVINFVPYFLFGIGVLPFLIIVYIFGVFAIFRGKFFKFTFKHIIGFVIFFIGVLMLMSVIPNKEYANGNNYLYLFNHLDDSGDNFITIDSFGLYKNSYKVVTVVGGEPVTLESFSFGGGYIGHFFAGLLINGTNAFAVYLVAIVAIIIGGALMFFNPIKKFVMAHAGKEKKQRNVDDIEIDNEIYRQPVINQPAPKASPAPAPVAPTNTTLSRVNNIDPVKGASVINRVENTRPVMTPSTPLVAPIDDRSSSGNPTFISSNSQYQFQVASGFVKAKFVRMNSQSIVEPSSTLVQPVPSVSIVKQEEIIPTKSEQLTLDFDDGVNETIEPNIPDNTPVTPINPVFRQEVVKETPVVTPVEPKPTPKPVKWISPSSDLLEIEETKEAEEINTKTAEERVEIINNFFYDFNLGAYVDGFTIGPSVTRFHVQYNSNVSSRSLLNAMSDISLRLGGVNARFEQVVAGKSYSGIEVQNPKVTMVTFKDVYEALPDVKKHPLAVAFGKNVQGDVIYADFNEFPHALLAGTTGSGKSVFINSVITTLIMRNSPDDLKLVLVDPKRVELNKYRDIPHLLCPVISEPQQAKLVMNKLVDEMNERYEKFDNSECSSLKEYNEYVESTGGAKMPYIVAIVDEFGDLVAATNKEISSPIVLLGQKARACGIHLLIATQRPSVDIITGVIKANLPTHIALCTATAVESTTILGQGGAEGLLGHGDMLVQTPILSRTSLVRLQGCFIKKQEISRVTGYLKEHYQTVYDERFINLEEKAQAAGMDAVASGSVASNMDAAEEAKYQSVKEWVMCQQYMSMSKIQGDCQVGFNRARRFFNRLQQEGVVGTEVEGNKGCKVLFHDPHTEIDLDSVPTSDEQSTIN